jgi:hypothetical protein
MTKEGGKEMKNGKHILITMLGLSIAMETFGAAMSQKDQAILNGKLYVALKNYDVDEVKKLLAAGANPNAETMKAPGTAETTIFNNFLYQTTTFEFEKINQPRVIELIPILCKAGAQLDNTGQQVFRGSFSKDSLEFIEALYKCGGNLKFGWMEHDAITNSHGKSLLFLQWLLDHGMDINDVATGNPLLLHTFNSLKNSIYRDKNENRFDHYYNIIKFLLAHGADIGIPGIQYIQQGSTLRPAEIDLFESLLNLKEWLSNSNYQKLLALFEEPIKKYVQEIRQTGPTGAPRPLPAGVSSIIGEYLVGTPAAPAQEQPKKETSKTSGGSEKEEMQEVD